MILLLVTTCLAFSDPAVPCDSATATILTSAPSVEACAAGASAEFARRPSEFAGRRVIGWACEVTDAH